MDNANERLEYQSVFSGYAVNDIKAARDFYESTLGADVVNDDMGLELHFKSQKIYMYEKADHVPATFTVLNIVVDDINNAVDTLVERGVVFETYDSLPAQQDERGVLRGLAANMGPDIAWFKDPAGNVLSVLQQA